MKCPECGTWTEVLETRKHGENGKRRRYECANEHRFTTLEQVVDGILRRGSTKQKKDVK